MQVPAEAKPSVLQLAPLAWWSLSTVVALLILLQICARERVVEERWEAALAVFFGAQAKSREGD